MKFIAALVALSISCCPAHAPVSTVKDVSVALVRAAEDGSIAPFCSGAFVANDLILTAGHCIQAYEDHYDQTDEDVKIAFVIPADVPNDVDDNPFSFHFTKLEKIDRTNDLALLKVLGPDGFPHSFAVVAKERPAIGEDITTYSSPHGQYFSYGTGVVSAYRHKQYEDIDTDFIEISMIGMYYGSSGSSVFNKSGEIIGVCSLTPGVPSMVMLVDPIQINKFLSATTKQIGE